MYTVEEAKNAVKEGIKGYLHKDANGTYLMKERNRLPFYLEGAPGIGKTELVGQTAEELGIGFVSFSLVHHTRNSLLGLPVIENLPQGEKYTNYTMSEVIAKVREQVELGKKEGILLLDEFPCMAETIVPVMLSFLQTKNIGEYCLPEGWVLVLCGNPPQFNKSARRFDSAVLDRLRKIEVAFDAACFTKYGKNIGLEPLVLSYLELYPQHAYRCEEKNGVAELVTCRGWENLSHAIRVYRELEQEIDRNCVRQFIKSDEICENFWQYVNQCRLGFSTEEMAELLSGKRYEMYKDRMCKLQTWQQMELFGSLCIMAENMSTKAEFGRAKYAELGERLSLLFELADEVDDGGVLAEKVYQGVNASEELQKTVMQVKLPRYLHFAEAMIKDEENFMNPPEEKYRNTV